MSRYIDVDAVTQSYQRLCSMITCTECPMYNGDGNECEIYLRVKNAPHIDIVRCKECKWWVVAMDENNSDEDYLKCPMDKWPNADEFCSFGERREP